MLTINKLFNILKGSDPKFEVFQLSTTALCVVFLKCWIMNKERKKCQFATPKQHGVFARQGVKEAYKGIDFGTLTMLFLPNKISLSLSNQLSLLTPCHVN